MPSLQLYLGMGKRRGDDPVHWMLILKDPEEDRGTWYHVTGGRGIYKVTIQDGKRFHSHGISEHHFICNFSASDRNKLKSACQRAKLARCQEWTTAVLGDLEQRGLVPEGTYSQWFHRIELSEWSTDGVHGLNRHDSSSRATQGGQTYRTTHSESSRAGQSRAYGSTSSHSSVDWIWDDKYQKYRYWDQATRKWVWQK
ncbi:hypothetical protein F5Y09DRAFT_312397 [Xylaria sp. FL1042]|nr:hypothetical protein F5Y09DRAFT_312397 [Xylaria sp. FL1042]